MGWNIFPPLVRYLGPSFIAKLSPSSSLAGLIGFILNLHQISGGTSQISSGTSQISGGTSQISGGTSGKVKSWEILIIFLSNF